MNRLIADFTVLNTKLHTYHYNVVGHEFYSLHVMLEKEYNTFHEWTDEVAEALKIAGEYPISNLKEMLELTAIKEASSKDYSANEILEDLIGDYQLLIEHMESVKEDLPMIQENLLEDFMTYLAKQIWFFKATIK